MPAHPRLQPLTTRGAALLACVALLGGACATAPPRPSEQEPDPAEVPARPDRNAVGSLWSVSFRLEGEAETSGKGMAAAVKEALGIEADARATWYRHVMRPARTVVFGNGGRLDVIENPITTVYVVLPSGGPSSLVAVVEWEQRGPPIEGLEFSMTTSASTAGTATGGAGGAPATYRYSEMKPIPGHSSPAARGTRHFFGTVVSVSWSFADGRARELVGPNTFRDAELPVTRE